MVIGAIFAGGSGSRMGCSETPKQYLTLGEKPVILHTIEKFYKNAAIDKVLILCPEQWVKPTCTLLEENFGQTDRIAVTTGGQDRNDTLDRALCYTEQHFGLDDQTIIVTHDAVRPFVTQRIINENIASAKRNGACGTYIPACDTIAESADGKNVCFVPERGRMWQTQTPQSFNVRKLQKTLAQLTPAQKANLTDVCAVFTLQDEPVHIVCGEVFNLKITYPYDLPIANALLAAGAGQE
ncbi:MAG: 2-C-methyl-D-erythritol 4-phosphate cytidylyltransferase [Clostridiales bacterium]|nr:2-C-methyl-D-erythritol 4-phosphate cytidylyltransferase [Clostridiales bacterium]